jgi:hypothetical protein
VRARAIVAIVMACVGLGACGDGDGTAQPATTTVARTTTTRSVEAQVRAQLGSLHRSTIAEVPRLVALFYHHPDGWAVEDTSLDDGATWCRHAWYRWDVTAANATDDFKVSYAPTTENPDCVPVGQPLVLHITARREVAGQVQLTGEYQPGALHATRTICPGTIDDFDDVCGLRSGLGPPTARPPSGP